MSRGKTLIFTLRVVGRGTSLVVQWVRLCVPNGGSPGSIPGHGTRSLLHAATKSLHTSAKIPHDTTKTRHSQNK